MASQLINYSLQVGTCLLLFYLFYRYLLRNQPSLHFNRGFLLFAPAAAFILPLLGRELNFAPADSLSPALQVIQLPEVLVTANSPSGGGFATIFVRLGVPELMLGLYGMVATLLLARLCLQLLLIRRMVVEAEPLFCIAPDVHVFQADEEQSSFAFLNYIFLNHPGPLSKDERQQVLDHEVAHVQLCHTYDVLFYEVLVVLQWFNPAVWLLRSELLDVHEFQADAHTLQKHEPQQYSTLLAKSALYANGIFIGSNFNKHQVLRRLQMLQHVGEDGSVLRCMLVVPLLGFLVFLLSAQQLSADIPYWPAPIEGAFYTSSPDMKAGRYQETTSVPKEDRSWYQDDIIAPDKTVQLTDPTKSSLAYVAVVSSPFPKNYIAVVRAGWPRQAIQAAPETNVQKVMEEEEKPYSFVEQMPSFIGGESAMSEYIAQNLKYPEDAMAKQVEGYVFVTFVVQKDGSITDTRILQGLGAGTDEEAIRVIQSMDGKWNPGRQRGREVPVRFHLPIRFRLN